MLVGIYKNPCGTMGKAIKTHDDIFRKIMDHNGIEHITLDASAPLFWEKVAGLDLFIFHWTQIDDHHQLAKTIIPIVEKEMGIKCFPDMATCWHFDDKIREYYLLRQHGFPVVESWVFWDKKPALIWLEQAEMPVVFKLKSGAGSNNVVLVINKSQAENLIKRMFGTGILSGQIPVRDNIATKYFDLFKTVHRWGGNALRLLRDEDITSDWQKHKNYSFFQKYLPKNDFDTRVTIIGDRAFAFRRFNRKADFRASGSGIIDYNTDVIDRTFVQLAFQISERLGFQSMAYDLLFDENMKPALIEISYAFIHTAIMHCPGYWDRDMNWHDGHFYPQFFQLLDALSMPDLRMPVIEES